MIIQKRDCQTPITGSKDYSRISNRRWEFIVDSAKIIGRNCWMNILWGIISEAPSPEYTTSGDYRSSAARTHLKGSLRTWLLLIHPTFCPRDPLFYNFLNMYKIKKAALCTRTTAYNRTPSGDFFARAQRLCRWQNLSQHFCWLLERKTRLELATPTLARLCSTNWAISANFPNGIAKVGIFSLLPNFFEKIC